MSLRTHVGDLWFFEGVPMDELVPLLEGLELRNYPAGAVVVAEGDRTREIYIPQAGSAEVVVAGHDGSEHRVGRVVPGGTVGEISLLTGQPAVATVRATSDLEMIVLSEDDFSRLATKFPQIYRNMGIILAERLARTNRLVVGRKEGDLIGIDDRDAPPLLSYALACSIAWHTHDRTLLLVLADEPPPDLVGLVSTSNEPPWRSGRPPGEPGADLMIAPPTGSFGADSLLTTFEALFGLFQHVLIHAPRETIEHLHTAHSVRLEGSDSGRAGAADGELVVCGWTAAENRLQLNRDRFVCVPALVAADEEALRSGALPAVTGAGRALGWAARDLTGLKVGLALGAGSIKGYAHVGVIDVLQRTGLEFDYVTGTSVGAAVAGLLALGNDAARIADILDEFSPNLFRVKAPYTSLLSDRGMRSYLRTMAPDVRIEDLPIPLALVAADIVTQRELVLRRGLLWQAVLASVAIPGVYPAQRIGPYVAVDGGVLNPLPVNVAAEMGAGTVIAVKLGAAAPRPEVDLEVVPATGRPPSALSVLMRSIEMMQRGISTEPTDATLVTIAPKLDTANVGLRNMRHGRRYIEDGFVAAEAALPRIAAALPWLR